VILPKVANDAPKSLTAESRLRLHDRQHGMCPWCGRNLNPDNMAAHHRLLRSAGGTWDLANIVGLHHGCHNVQPGSVHQEPRRAYSLGFMIRSRLVAPADVPVYSRVTHEWWLPDADGAKTIIHASLAVELIEAAGGLTRKGAIS
jgi:hypothetical protein